MLTPQQIKVLDEVFYKWGSDKFHALEEADVFAHYTSASVALGIINGRTDETRCLWLRNAGLMNDFSEVEYGQSMLRMALQNQHIAIGVKQACDFIHQDVFKVFEELDKEYHHVKNHTFLLSLVRHRGIEQHAGKLSMWRAYGGNANVCLVLKKEPLVNPQEVYDVNLSPVNYDGPGAVQKELERIIGAMIAHQEVLRTVDAETIRLNFKAALDNIVLSSKHPGFIEEDEWRVIKKRDRDPALDSTPSKVVEVNGIVQEVYYIPMRNKPELGLNGAELNELLVRVIVGPTPNPEVMRIGFIRALLAAGIEDAFNKVNWCGIPLRR